ncbi:MAG: DUF1624 domain-containing protein [Candidatus Diapherotrites archaeon]|uniref:DUF1624 domain-containing protein n=1 Tax=Candidatus Iainarchaeum sp. TaxID=3101447 RepID=A0A8T4L1A4_9ARCH|nr:DUF1624 domain-containing protein [Candidatus Diapherotrites archaeon]
MSARWIEIDALRGIAIVAMILFHFLFDYNFFVGPRFDVYSGVFFWLGRVAAFLFVFVAGLSLYVRVFRRNLDGYGLIADFVSRGLFLLGIGFLITLFTLVFFPDYVIWFGVLHLLGVATMLSIPFVSRPRFSFWAGIAVVAAGIVFSQNGTWVPDWIVLFPFSFQTFDYFPLFPWFGVFLLGIAAADRFFPKGQKTRVFGWVSGRPVRLLGFLGRHSLVLYLVHQPVLVGLIWIGFRFFSS